MAGRLGRGSAVATIAVVVGSVWPSSPAPVLAAPTTVTPAGMTTIVEGGAWSWFSDARATFDPGGTLLYTSAAVGPSTLAPTGTVVVSELSTATGARRHVGLGTAEPDDHNAASVWVADDGEVTTSWARHRLDQQVRTHRRRVGGSWLELPPIATSERTTYSNLLSGHGEDGAEVLYDFFRGERFDPEVLASPDRGRTWARLGRLLRDPLDRVTTRPYVQLRATTPGRIDVVATEGHPDDVHSAVYHGFITSGRLHRSDGTVLGPVGSATSVTDLTRVSPPGLPAAWLADLVEDPATGAPVVAFTTRHGVEDHRYWLAEWSGTSWSSEEVAFGGSALYPAEPSYSGLVAIDPIDPSHLVISTDVDPLTRVPRRSAADGQTHWELWDGRRRPSGTWSWSPLTSDSVVDNLRPVLTSHPNGSQALLWMRGTYTTYLSHDVDLVGVVTAPGGRTVAASPTSAATSARRVLAGPAPSATAGVPIAGQLDDHSADDVFLYRPGTSPEALLLGDDQQRPTPVAPRSVVGTYRPVAGDFDGNGTTDIYWYAAGRATDHLWTTSRTGTFTDTPAPAVNGTYTPIAGDFDGNGTTDIHWYAPGPATDHLWLAATNGTFQSHPTPAVNGTYTPIAGDFDGNGTTDIHWYAPGAGRDYAWWAVTGPDGGSVRAAVDL